MEEDHSQSEYVGFMMDSSQSRADKVKEVEESCGSEFVFHFSIPTVALPGTKSVSFQFERWPTCTLSSASEMSQVVCGHLAHFCFCRDKRWSSYAVSANASGQWRSVARGVDLQCKRPI